MQGLIQQLQMDLSEARFLHSMRVAECASRLASRFSCDLQKAYTAGLLHDCATKLSEEEILALAFQLGISGEGTGNPLADYHAELGAYIAKKDYGITDPELLQAIAFHQMGGIPMTPLDMVVGLADGIEPSRKGSAIDAIRLAAEQDLLKAYTEKYVLYMCNTLNSHKPLPQRRVDVYRYLLELNH